jgi:hypothetical protein
LAERKFFPDFSPSRHDFFEKRKKKREKNVRGETGGRSPG